MNIYLTSELAKCTWELVVIQLVIRFDAMNANIENIELQRPFYRYSANADGSSMTTSPQASTRYLGTYVGTRSKCNIYRLYLDFNQRCRWTRWLMV